MLPTFYVPHGAPAFALQPGAAGAAMANAAAALKPRAIVVASAHWDTAAPTVGGAMRPETIHDFWGFPEPLYDVAYGAPGTPDVAGDVVGLLAQAGFDASLQADRDLDHAVWIPLRIMFPRADVPVVPLSIQAHLGPEHHYHMGLALAPLARDNVLVIGSGNLTHNLRDWQAASSSMSYVREFADWVWRRIDTGDLRALLDYRRQAPEAQRAHPTEDHLLPLYVALGAAGAGFSARRIHAGIDERVLAMDAFAFQPETGALQ
jgi:4,5-DOPA dioxygenase extradiol